MGLIERNNYRVGFTRRAFNIETGPSPFGDGDEFYSLSLTDAERLRDALTVEIEGAKKIIGE